MAIDNSLEIRAIDERLVLGDENIDHAKKRRWTNYITLDPIRLVQNVLGGGDVQRDRIDIAELELRQADLIRRRWEVTEDTAQTVVDLVLDWESLDRRVGLQIAQLQTQRQREAVVEAGYRTGSGSTTSMLSIWQRTEDLEARLLETEIDKTQIRQELEGIIYGPVDYQETIAPTRDTTAIDSGDIRSDGLADEPEH